MKMEDFDPKFIDEMYWKSLQDFGLEVWTLEDSLWENIDNLQGGWDEGD